MHLFLTFCYVQKKGEEDESDDGEGNWTPDMSEKTCTDENENNTTNFVDDGARATQLPNTSNGNGQDDGRWGYVVSMDSKSRMVKIKYILNIKKMIYDI